MVFFKSYVCLNTKNFVTVRVGRLTSDVLFSTDAFKTLDISQGRVATHLRCDGILVIVLLQILS